MTIKIKSMLMGVAATSAILGGMAFQSSSAQAINFKNGDTIGIGGNVLISKDSGGLLNFTFAAPAVQTVKGPSSSIPPFVAGDQVTITNLSSLASGDIFGPIGSFISGIALNDGVDTDTAYFDLTRGKFKLIPTGGGNNTLSLTLMGEFFSSTDVALGNGSLTTQIRNFPLNNLVLGGPGVSRELSADLAVVPTPAAVLPALLGMGTAAFRKKKREGEEELAIAGVEEE